MKIYVMENGHIRMPFFALVDYGNPDDRGRTADIPITSYLIDHEDGYVLIDCGLSKYEPRSVNGGMGASEEPYEEQTSCLRDIGVSPDDIKYVICSHLHVDHSGYLGFYKNAEIFVHENEYENVIENFGKGPIPEAYIREDIESFRSSGLKFRPVGGVCELKPFLPGIDIIALGEGHTFGMLGVMLHTKEHGNVIIAQDAMYSHLNWGPPVTPPGLVKSREGFMRSAEYLKKLCEEYSATIIFGHDAEQFAKLRKHREGYYE